MTVFRGTSPHHRRRRQVRVGGCRLMLSPGCRAPDRLQDPRVRQIQGEFLPLCTSSYMAAYIYDNKVLIHCFHDSLTRAALSWYVALERGRIKTWRDLVEVFLK
ncbi:hypothetical protein CR513_42322, partial [Mucuna pruriens]